MNFIQACDDKERIKKNSFIVLPCFLYGEKKKKERTKIKGTTEGLKKRCNRN